MIVHLFIVAEKQGGHSVKLACELLGVSRAAFYARRSGMPGPRAVRDAEPAERVAEVHARSRGSYGAPRVHARPTTPTGARHSSANSARPAEPNAPA
ncbi:hypothetical protein [Nonomuraea sp. NPDC049625]|uniref:hypothetical protein n=1 Tax=Nonomuraea sp. NPDC049625 TaxID=3155775 RepID=UPI00342D6C82